MVNKAELDRLIRIYCEKAGLTLAASSKRRLRESILKHQRHELRSQSPGEARLALLQVIKLHVYFALQVHLSQQLQRKFEGLGVDVNAALEVFSWRAPANVLFTKERPGAYAHQVAYNCCQEQLRTRSRRQRLLARKASLLQDLPPLNAEETLIHHESARLILDVLHHSFSDPERAFLLACFVEGRAAKAAAEALGWPSVPKAHAVRLELLERLLRCYLGREPTAKERARLKSARGRPRAKLQGAAEVGALEEA